MLVGFTVSIKENVTKIQDFKAKTRTNLPTKPKFVLEKASVQVKIKHCSWCLHRCIKDLKITCFQVFIDLFDKNDYVHHATNVHLEKSRHLARGSKQTAKPGLQIRCTPY